VHFSNTYPHWIIICSESFVPSIWKENAFAYFSININTLLPTYLPTFLHLTTELEDNTDSIRTQHISGWRSCTIWQRLNSPRAVWRQRTATSFVVSEAWLYMSLSKIARYTHFHNPMKSTSNWIARTDDLVFRKRWRYIEWLQSLNMSQDLNPESNLESSESIPKSIPSSETKQSCHTNWETISKCWTTAKECRLTKWVFLIRVCESCFWHSPAEASANPATSFRQFKQGIGGNCSRRESRRSSQAYRRPWPSSSCSRS